MNSDKSFLYFRIKNSVHEESKDDLEQGGLGLVNMRKRLDLIYGKSYTLQTSKDKDLFEINIKLPLDAN